MKKNIIKSISGIIILLGTFFLSGCASIERELEFKGNGLIGINESVVIQEDLIKMSYQSVDDFYAQVDSQVTTGNYLIFSVTKLKTKLNNSDAYGYSIEGTATEEIVEKMLSSNDATFDIEKTGFIVKDIKISITSPNGSTYNNMLNTQSGNDFWSDLSNQIGSSLSSMVSDTFAVRVPGKILSTNGFVDADNNKRIVWDISDVEMGNTTSKELNVSYIDTGIITTLIILMLVGTILLILFFVILILLITKKNKKKGKTNTTNGLENYLSKFVNDGGRIIYDVYVPGVDNVVGKIDAILIHDSGIYLFDKKKNEGWISGNEMDSSWIVTTKDEEQITINNPVKQTLAQTAWLKKNIEKIVDVYSIIIYPENANLASVTNNNSKIKVIRGNKFEGVIESFRVTRGIVFQSEIIEIYNEIEKIKKM